MVVVMKQLDQSDEAIEAIMPFHHPESQDSIVNLLIDLYKVACKYEEEIQMLMLKVKLEEGFALAGERTKIARSQGRKIEITIEKEYARLLGNLAWSYVQRQEFRYAEENYRLLCKIVLHGSLFSSLNESNSVGAKASDVEMAAMSLIMLSKGLELDCDLTPDSTSMADRTKADTSSKMEPMQSHSFSNIRASDAETVNTCEPQTGSGEPESWRQQLSVYFADNGWIIVNFETQQTQKSSEKFESLEAGGHFTHPDKVNQKLKCSLCFGKGNENPCTSPFQTRPFEIHGY